MWWFSWWPHPVWVHRSWRVTSIRASRLGLCHTWMVFFLLIPWTWIHWRLGRLRFVTISLAESISGHYKRDFGIPRKIVGGKPRKVREDQIHFEITDWHEMVGWSLVISFPSILVPTRGSFYRNTLGPIVSCDLLSWHCLFHRTLYAFRNSDLWLSR